MTSATRPARTDDVTVVVITGGVDGYFIAHADLDDTLRVGSERAHLGQPEVTVGIIPGAGGTQRLPRIVGPAVAAELCLTGRVVQADEALRIGLLNTMLPTEGFLDHVLEWCTQITRNPAMAVFAAKRAVVDGLGLPLDEGLRLEAGLFREVNATPEARAANQTFPRPAET